jgi:hypothetical protein
MIRSAASHTEPVELDLAWPLWIIRAGLVNGACLLGASCATS